MQLDNYTFREYYTHTINISFLITAILLWVSVIGYALTQQIHLEQFGVLFLGLAVVSYILNELREMGMSGDPAAENVDDVADFSEESHGSVSRSEAFKPAEAIEIAFMLFLIVLTVISSYYYYTNFLELATIRIGFATTTDQLVGGMMLFVIFYLTYRAFGVPFVAVIAIATGYAYFGPYFPGFFSHSGLGWERLLQISVTDVEGIYGNLNRLMASWIALFLLYAGLMQGYGAFNLILRGAVKTAKYVQSGVAQSAVVASMLIGSVNGSATANTGITGSLTIPLMKENGLKPQTAAGIESVASTGGQVIPPVMGAAAFLMASILARPYTDILIASLVPAVIFYTSLVVAVHLTSVRQLDGSGVELDIGDKIDAVLTRRELVFEGIRFGVPFFVLIYFLGVAQFTVITSALYTCIAMVAFGAGMPVMSDPNRQTLRDVGSQTLDGLKIGAVTTGPIAIIIACINGIVDILLATGIPSTLAVTLLEVSGGVLIVAVIVSMAICIILGLGMPTSAAYLVVALLVAPGLISEFGIPALSAHYFVLYATILASITPPIATGVAVASGIAKAGFWSTAYEAIKIGGPLYILPIMFIYHPEIISADPTAETLYSGAIGLGGSIVMVYGFNAPKIINFYFHRLSAAFYIVMGIFIMMYPSHLVRIALLGVVLMFLVVRRYLLRQIDEDIHDESPAD